MSSSILKPDATLSLAISSTNPNRLESASLRPEARGVKLIQLLLSCAKHASSGNLNRADNCLQQITRLASPTGDSMERLAVRFASALAIRLVKRWPGLYKALGQAQLARPQLDRAKTLFARSFPYLTFAYAIVARTLLRAMAHERLIHVVDLGPGDPKLWVPLLQSFAKIHNNGPSHVRVTCVTTNKSALQKLGTRLVKEAEALNMPFQFHPILVPLRDLTTEMLEVRSGEALAFASILNLHVLLAEDDQVDAHFGINKNSSDIKESQKMTEFLSALRSLSPKVLLLVEQESDQNLNRLSDRFTEGLHYYSAVFDSIDASLGDEKRSAERVVIEEMFGREIENIVACEGIEREERHERYVRWAVRFGRTGFRPVQLWCDPMEDAKKMVEAYGKDGYKIISERSSFMICWHDRPIYAVSAWTC